MSISSGKKTTIQSKTIEQEAYEVACSFIEDDLWKYRDNVKAMARLLVAFYNKGHTDSSKEYQKYIQELHCARNKYE